MIRIFGRRGSWRGELERCMSMMAGSLTEIWSDQPGMSDPEEAALHLGVVGGDDVIREHFEFCGLGHQI